MNNNNLAQKTNFTAGSDKLELSSLFLSSVNIPGVNLSHPEVGGRSGVRLNVGADSMVFNALSFELLVDEDFKIYHEFMDKIFNKINPESGSFANTEFDFWVEIMNSKGNKLFKIEFSSCRIESIGDIQLETSSDETEFLLSVEIKYDFYKIIKTNQTIPTLRV